MNVRSLLGFAPLSFVVISAAVAGCAASGASNADGSRGDDIGREAESVKCADGTTVEGIDVSYYDGSPNWAAVKASGRAFAIARINDGTFNDPKFAANWAGIKAAGMIRGAYQFFEPTDDATWQANLVVTAVGKLGAGDLPVTLDAEVVGGKTPAELASYYRTWSNIVAAGTGKTPIIYVGYYFWRDDVGGADFSSSALWIAAYGPTCPTIPSPWTDWKFFQYSDTVTVPGISGDVDADRFNGTLADLTAFAGGDGTSGTSSGSSGGTTTTPGCYSSTLGEEVPPNACVQSKSDSNWYQCDTTQGWIDRATDPNACDGTYPLGSAGPSSGTTPTTPAPTNPGCYSSTLGKTMPYNACVQSQSDSSWYQCDGSSGWVDRWTDTQACDGTYPL